MFGIGTTEFLVIIVVAILVLGPEHLPRIMRTFTKVMSDFRRVSTDFQRTINLEVNQEEWRQEQAALSTAKKKTKRPASDNQDSQKASASSPPPPADELTDAAAATASASPAIANEPSVQTQDVAAQALKTATPAQDNKV